VLTSLFPLESILPLGLQVAAVGLWLGLLLIVAEGLHRFTQTDSEVVRKVVHIGTGNVILLAWWLQIPGWVAIAASIVAGTIALISYKFPILPGINSVGRQSLGTFFYAISIGILVAWFWPLQLPQYPVIGILIMTYGDGLAALIGQRFGQHPYQFWGEKKSWEGSATMAVVSFIVTASILTLVEGNLWNIGLIALGVAGVATILEAFSKLGIDNLTVPIGSAAFCFFLHQIW
jgi:phytol kinase